MTFLYYISEVMVKFTRKARGHFVTVTEVVLHLIEPAFLGIKYGFLVSLLKKPWYCVGGRVKQKFGFIKLVDKD